MKMPILTNDNAVVERNTNRSDMDLVIELVNNLPIITLVPQQLAEIVNAKSELYNLAGNLKLKDLKDTLLDPLTINHDDVLTYNIGTGKWISKESTGNGKNVLDTSAVLITPTLITPNIGTAIGTSFNDITGLSYTIPLIAGTATTGTGTTTARADHVHPAQTIITGNAGSATVLQTARTINGVSFNGSANISVNTNNSEIIKFDSGVTEGTDLYTFNGSSTKTIDIKGTANNITLTKTSGAVTFDVGSNVVNTTSSQSLSNKTLQDSTTYIVDNTDVTKKVQFEVSGVTTGTTRTLTVPNVSGTLITTGDTGTVTNTMLATISTSGKVANSATTATNLNTASTIVSRDASGNFIAGTITASLTGNSSTTTKLAATKNINGVAFDGSIDINIEDRLGIAIASADTITIGTTGLGDYIHITGTTRITSFGAATTAGIRRTLIFDSGLTLTHNATTLICPGSENLVAVAGTVIEVVAETIANWRVVSVTHPSLSITELGYLDGITSNIQTQLDSKVERTSATGSAKIPAGTTAQRDASPIDGMIRYNSTLKGFEGYFNGTWQSVGGGQMFGNAVTKAVSYNAQTISENIDVTAGVNAYSVGDVTIANGYTLTIANGSIYKIL